MEERTIQISAPINTFLIKRIPNWGTGMGVTRGAGRVPVQWLECRAETDESPPVQRVRSPGLFPHFALNRLLHIAIPLSSPSGTGIAAEARGHVCPPIQRTRDPGDQEGRTNGAGPGRRIPEATGLAIVLEPGHSRPPAA